jgi:hypothetical protein
VVTLATAIGEILRRNALCPNKQLERYCVEQFKRGRWVVVGHFNATSDEEARQLARAALANKIVFLRALRVGSPQMVRGLAEEGVRL